MTSVPRQQNQTTYVTQGYVVNTPSNDGIEKHARTFLILGVFHIVLACLSLILGIAILAFSIDRTDYSYYGEYYDVFAYFVSGIWTSIFFFTSGILGVLQGKKKTRCLLVAALTMTIFSALAATALFGMELSGALVSSSYYDKSGFYREWNVSTGIHSALCFIGFTEVVVSIVHSAYCCGAHCCDSSSTAVASQTTHAYVNPTQIAPIPGQQTTFVQGPPMAPGVMHQQYVITTPQPAVVSYQTPAMQGGYVATQPNIPPLAQPNQQWSPPDYETSTQEKN